MAMTVRNNTGEPSYRFNLEGVTMNWHKIRNVVNYIKKKGMPTDPYGQLLSADEMVDWYDLRGRLNDSEIRQIKKELTSMIEAEVLMIKLQTEGI